MQIIKTTKKLFLGYNYIIIILLLLELNAQEIFFKMRFNTINFLIISKFK